MVAQRGKPTLRQLLPLRGTICGTRTSVSLNFVPTSNATEASLAGFRPNSGEATRVRQGLSGLKRTSASPRGRHRCRASHWPSVPGNVQPESEREAPPPRGAGLERWNAALGRGGRSGTAAWLRTRGPLVPLRRHDTLPNLTRYCYWTKYQRGARPAGWSGLRRSSGGKTTPTPFRPLMGAINMIGGSFVNDSRAPITGTFKPRHSPCGTCGNSTALGRATNGPTGEAADTSVVSRYETVKRTRSAPPKSPRRGIRDVRANTFCAGLVTTEVTQPEANSSQAERGQHRPKRSPAGGGGAKRSGRDARGREDVRGLAGRTPRPC